MTETATEPIPSPAWTCGCQHDDASRCQSAKPQAADMEAFALDCCICDCHTMPADEMRASGFVPAQGRKP